MESSIIVALITSTATIVGVIITSVVAYTKTKNDRLNAYAEVKLEEAKEKQKLYDRLDKMDEKLDLHNEKLDKHNGFEGRIITLETIVTNMAKEFEKKGKR